MICTVIKCDRCGDEWNITKAGFKTLPEFWADYNKKNEYEIRPIKGGLQVILCDRCNRALERFIANEE